MIDFTPGQPAGEISWIVIAWVASGMIGMAVRGWLLHKYRTDLKYSESIGASDARKSISREGIGRSLRHIVVKLLIIVIGVASAIVEFNTPGAPPPNIIGGLALLAIPWILTIDAFSELRHQLSLLNVVEPVRDMLEVAESTNTMVRELGEAIQANTALTEKAVERADAAYVESNHANEKIAHLTQAAVVTNQEGNVLLTAAAETGEETLVRVIRVEHAVTKGDETAAQLATEAANRDERLDALEERSPSSGNVEDALGPKEGQ